MYIVQYLLYDYIKYKFFNCLFVKTSHWDSTKPVNELFVRI